MSKAYGRAALWLLLFPALACADVSLPRLLGDGVVLQRDAATQ